MLLSKHLALQHRRRPLRVRRVTFLPHIRSIHAGLLRMTSGLESLCPLAQQAVASYAVRVPRTGNLPAASLGFRVAPDNLAVRLGVPVIKASIGTCTRPVTSWFAFAPQLRASVNDAPRHARRTKRNTVETIGSPQCAGMSNSRSKSQWEPTLLKSVRLEHVEDKVMAGVVPLRSGIVIRPLAIVDRNLHLGWIAIIETIGAAVVLVSPEVLWIINVRIVLETIVISLTIRSSPHPTVGLLRLLSV